MRFQARIPVVIPFVAGVDPIAAPQSVKPEDIIRVGAADPEGNQQRLALAFEAAAGKTLTVEIYAVDESTLTSASADDPFAGADLRRFYLVGAAAVVLTANRLTPIPLSPGGCFYLRQTATTALATSALHAAQIPAGLV